MARRSIISATETECNGHTIYTMTREHRDARGHVWPAGTEFTAAASGYDYLRGGAYREVVIRGERALFLDGETYARPRR